MRCSSLFAFALSAVVAGSAFAQAPPTRIRGTVETFSDHSLTVKARDGADVSIALAPDFKVRAVEPRTLADIKPGDKVGITSVNGSAIEIHIFPASLTNVPMRQTPWDLGPGSLMTNAPVLQVTGPTQGQTIKVTLDGKETAFTVPPGTPIVTYGPGDASLLKPGVSVFVIARKQPGGGLQAASVTAEKNGVKPPM